MSFDRATVCDKSVAPRDAPDAEARCQRAPVRTAGHPVAYRFAVRRRLLIAAICLLAGAVVNVAVAWGCWSGIRSPNVGKKLPAEETRKIAKDLGLSSQLNSDGIPSVTYGGRMDSGFGTTLDIVQIGQVVVDPGFDFPTRDELLKQGPEKVADLVREHVQALFGGAKRIQAGWPTLALRGYEITGLIDSNSVMQGRATGAWPPTEFRWALPVRKNKPSFPLRPIWPGFAVNTAFYAAILWLLICEPFVIRKYIRMKRGRCVQCAYPMGASGVCSECGKTIPSPKVTAT